MDMAGIIKLIKTMSIEKFVTNDYNDGSGNASGEGCVKGFGFGEGYASGYNVHRTSDSGYGDGDVDGEGCSIGYDNHCMLRPILLKE